MNNRNEREAEVLANLEADALIEQATRINRSVRYVAIVVLIVAALLVGFNWPKPAEAASRPVFKGTVTICVSPSKKSDPYGQYVNTMWDVSKAAKAAKIGKYRVVKDRYPRDTCYGDVYVGSDTSTRSSRVYKLVDSGEIWESQVTMGDKWGKAHTSAQRHNELVKALRMAVPR